MPKINVYLPDDLAEAVKDAGLPVSAICQRALEQGVRRVTAMRAITNGTPGTSSETWFTKRAMTILESSLAVARDAGLDAAGTGQLLAALVADEDGIAMRVLGALEITGQQIRTALGDRADKGPADTGSPDAGPVGTADGGTATAVGFGPEAATALQLAAAESAGLGHNYIGTEHLLLGLIGEPDGVAGGALRALGAELRMTRRAVTAALAGWAAHAERPPRPAAASEGSVPEDHVAAAVRAEVAPILSRIERLERMAASQG
jgi:ATP-dependent Clp protease ATP-binding subunit ClpA